MSRVYIVQRRIDPRFGADARFSHPVSAHTTRKLAKAEAERRNAKASCYVYSVRRSSIKVIS